MPEAPNFYDTLFNHKKIINVLSGQDVLSANDWDCRLGIFTNQKIVHGGDKEKLIQDMMAACKIPPSDWRIFPPGTSVRALSELEHCATLLLFGVAEKVLNLNIILPFYQPMRWNGKIWIKTHSLEDLLKKPEYKKALWIQALKPVFAG